MRVRRPVIGIPADRRMLGPHPFHAVGEKYITAVLDAAQALPLVIPSLGKELALEELLEELDGLLFTGSPSNVEPHRYGGEPSRAGHAARPRARCDDAAADPARHRSRRARARRVPRLPGNERRLRRHALAARRTRCRASTCITRTDRSRWTCSTGRRTTVDALPRAACCRPSRAPSAADGELAAPPGRARTGARPHRGGARG